MARDQSDDPFMALIRAIAASDESSASSLLRASPALATNRAATGATRQNAKDYFLDPIGHYIYAGDTALHIAAAAYRTGIARRLVKLGSDVGALNRRGATPLHYAVDGMPGSATWNPAAQAKVIDFLVDAGADPNAMDKGGVTPLHRAVRNRCAMAVRALLEAGADPRRKNGNGSTPCDLALENTGRGGSGTLLAKAQQAEILQLLESSDARRQ